ncbi:MAG: hypothetical protein HRU70_03670 [Phycisphaeraceae bacterium]|nr:MAG: hypothetical protein HRU70_03670 [Phycisphaeraceae bacterium]
MRPRRAFIMALVVLMATVMSILIALVIDRQTSQWLSIKRQLSDYEAGHAQRGLEEIIQAWLTNGASARMSFRERIGEGDHLLDIELPEGLTGRSRSAEIVRVFASDAQASVLKDFSGLMGESLREARAILGSVRERFSVQDAARFTRDVGPVAVSAWESPAELLYAVSEAVTGSREANRAVDDLLRAREDPERFRSEGLQSVLNKASVEPEKVAALMRVVTADVTLWRLRVDIVREGALVDGYQGLLLLPGRAGRDASSTGGRRGVLLEFMRRVDLRSQEPGGGSR